jgi:acyl-coenzyme A thioesterase PaaI-like protein
VDENEFQLRAGLADSTRRLIRAVRLTHVDGGRLHHATDLIDEACDTLEAMVFEGPHSQVEVDPETRIDPSVPPAEFFPYSSVIGPLNPIAAPVELEIVDLTELPIEGPAVSETGKGIRGRVVLPEQYIGPPWNLAHGGVIAQLFDELLGVATIMGARGGFTGRLTVHYRRPTPALQPLELAAWVESVSGRKLVARGEIRHQGVVTAEADGLFVRTAVQEAGDPPPILADAPD